MPHYVQIIDSTYILMYGEDSVSISERLLCSGLAILFFTGCLYYCSFVYGQQEILNRTYENNAGNYKINYPADWSVIKYPHYTLITPASSRHSVINGPLGSVGVSLAAVNSSSSTDDLFTSSSTDDLLTNLLYNIGIMSPLPTPPDVTQSSPTTISGNLGYTITYRNVPFPCSHSPITERITVALILNHKMFIISYYDLNGINPVMQNIVNSFEFLNQNGLELANKNIRDHTNSSELIPTGYRWWDG